jgi:hypothetical protein
VCLFAHRGPVSGFADGGGPDRQAKGDSVIAILARLGGSIQNVQIWARFGVPRRDEDGQLRIGV